METSVTLTFPEKKIIYINLITGLGNINFNFFTKWLNKLSETDQYLSRDKIQNSKLYNCLR